MIAIPGGVNEPLLYREKRIEIPPLDHGYTSRAPPVNGAP